MDFVVYSNPLYMDSFCIIPSYLFLPNNFLGSFVVGVIGPTCGLV